MSTWTDLVAAIEGELQTLNIRAARKPFDGAAGMELENQFWITNESGTRFQEMSGKYIDTETVTVIIAEKIDFGNPNKSVKDIGDRRDTIRKNLTDHAFHVKLPTLIHQVLYTGHDIEAETKYLKNNIHFEFKLKRTI